MAAGGPTQREAPDRATKISTWPVIRFIRIGAFSGPAVSV
jgi:hypothetical protein